MLEGVHERYFHEANKVIFNMGDPGRAFYYIDSGTVDLWDKKESQSVKVMTLKKGDIFGEMALLDSGPRLYSAITGDAGATLVTVNISYMEKVLGESHPFVKLLIKRLLENMRKFSGNPKNTKSE